MLFLNYNLYGFNIFQEHYKTLVGQAFSKQG